MRKIKGEGKCENEQDWKYFRNIRKIYNKIEYVILKKEKRHK